MIIFTATSLLALALAGTAPAAIVHVHVDGGLSWDNWAAKCAETGHEMCSYDQICPDGFGNGLGGIYRQLKDSEPIGNLKADGFPGWAPLSDTHNDWAYGSNCKRPVGHRPGWGRKDGSGYAEDAYCCAPVAPAAPAAVMYIKLARGLSYDNWAAKCAETGHQLCSYDQICPNGFANGRDFQGIYDQLKDSEPIGNLANGFPGWNPIADAENDWAYGSNCKRPVGHRPGWGRKDGSGYAEMAYCCAPGFSGRRRVPALMDEANSLVAPSSMRDRDASA